MHLLKKLLLPTEIMQDWEVYGYKFTRHVNTIIYKNFSYNEDLMN